MRIHGPLYPIIYSVTIFGRPLHVIRGDADLAFSYVISLAGVSVDSTRKLRDLHHSFKQLLNIMTPLDNTGRPIQYRPQAPTQYQPRPQQPMISTTYRPKYQPLPPPQHPNYRYHHREVVSGNSSPDTVEYPKHPADESRRDSRYSTTSASSTIKEEPFGYSFTIPSAPRPNTYYSIQQGYNSIAELQQVAETRDDEEDRIFKRQRNTESAQRYVFSFILPK
jgi:hypothetical protein